MKKPDIFKKTTRHSKHSENVATSHISENTSLPQKKVAYKKPLLVFVIIIGLVVAGVLISRNLSRRDTTATIETPAYQTVLPKDSSVKELGGWKKLTPPNGKPFFTYTDTIDAVPIKVSQQQLPEAFKSDVAGNVADVAKGYNADDRLKAGDTTIYIGISSKGPQSVIFTKDNLLILISSQKKIKDASWIRYVSSLTVR